MRMAPPSPLVTDACTAVPAIEAVATAKADQTGVHRRGRLRPGAGQREADLSGLHRRRGEQRRQRGCVGYRERQAHIVEPLVVEEEAAGGGEPDPIGGDLRVIDCQHPGLGPAQREGKADPAFAERPGGLGKQRRQLGVAGNRHPGSPRRLLGSEVGGKPDLLADAAIEPTAPVRNRAIAGKHQPHRRAAVEAEGCANDPALGLIGAKVEGQALSRRLVQGGEPNGAADAVGPDDLGLGPDPAFPLRRNLSAGTERHDFARNRLADLDIVEAEAIHLQVQGQARQGEPFVVRLRPGIAFGQPAQPDAACRSLGDAQLALEQRQGPPANLGVIRGKPFPVGIGNRQAGNGEAKREPRPDRLDPELGLTRRRGQRRQRPCRRPPTGLGLQQGEDRDNEEEDQRKNRGDDPDRRAHQNASPRAI